MITIEILNGNICQLDGDRKAMIKLYDLFRVKHPNAWHILMYNKNNHWDGYIKYISDSGRFKIGLLPKVYEEATKLGQKVKIVDKRAPIPTPVIQKTLGDKELFPRQIKALERILFNKVGGVPFNIVAGDLSVGFGKCIGGESRVFTNKGILQIKDMVDTEGQLTGKYKVLSVDGQYHNVTGGVFNRIKAIRITTTQGYTQVCGYDKHRYLTVDSSGILNWILARDLVEGDYIPIYKPDNKSTKPSDQYLLDEAYLMGNLHGDGHLSKLSDTRVQVSISGVDPENRDEIVRIFNIITKTPTKWKPHRKIKNGWHISKSDKKLSKIILSKYPEIATDSHYKTIPQYIMNAPKDIVCQYIAGLWDTDGSLHQDNREYSFGSVNPECINMLHTLLLSIGIHSYVSSKKTSWTNKRTGEHKRGISYRLRVPGTQVDKFSELIPIRIQRKKRSKHDQRNNYDDRLPIQVGRLARDWYLSNYNTRYTFPNKNKTVRKQLRNPERLTPYALSELMKYNQGNICLQEISVLTEKAYWDKIKSIEIIDEYDCYDICVKGTHHYIADGFICHNTMLFAAIHQAFQNKLKTILLLNDSDLFNQFKREIPPMLPGINVQFIQGGNVKQWGEFNVAMVQSISRNLKKYQWNLSCMDICLIDEADIIDNRTYKGVIEHLYNSRIRVGLSGTIYMSKLKKDLVHNLNVMSFIGQKVDTVKLIDQMKAGKATPVVVKMVLTDIPDPMKHNYTDEYNAAITYNSRAYGASFNRALYNAKYGRTPMLIVTKFIDHCEKLYEFYQDMNKRMKLGWRIAYVHHETKDRNKILEDFRTGKIDVLISTTIISRGKNFPELRYLQNTASMDSNEKAIQILGRLVRQAEGKSKAYLDDLVFSGRYLLRHGKHRKVYYQKEKLKVIIVKQKKS